VSDGRLDVVEVAYRFDLDEHALVRSLVDVLAARFEPHAPLIGFISQLESDGRIHYRTLHTLRDERGVLPAVFGVAAESATTADQHRIFRSAPARHSLTTLLTRSLHARARACGVTEVVGVNCPAGNGAIVLGSVRKELYVPTPGERTFWRPVAAHLSAAVQLRDTIRRPPLTTFHADGRIAESAVRDGHVLACLRDAVLVREAARARKRSAPGALWPAMVAGQWAIVDRFEASGRRYVVAHRVPAAAATLHVLTARERAILDATVRGEANKAIAIDLGLSEATVSRCLASGLRKLGCNVAEMIEAQRSDAQALAMGPRQVALLRGPLTASHVAQLTATERLVLEQVLRGASAGEIARRRRRSARTVTNQLCAIYEKLGVHSRRELLLRVTPS